jgi:hypothetical protein
MTPLAGILKETYLHNLQVNSVPRSGLWNDPWDPFLWFIHLRISYVLLLLLASPLGSPVISLPTHCQLTKLAHSDISGYPPSMMDTFNELSTAWAQLTGL